jgi:hypothetical protein
MVLRDEPQAILLIAGVMIFMLVIGIRNAWDLAVWIPLQERNPDRRAGAAAPGRTASPAPESGE